MSIELRPSDVHNTRLLDSVHPADWVDPTPSSRYNLVVLGAGTAGLVAAAGAAGLGAKVALVERGLMGGDCLNAGCVPSKALLRSARVAATVRAAARYGVESGTVRVDFPAVMERMRRLRAELAPIDSASRFRELGVDVFLGEGKFTGRDTLAVNGKELRFRKAVIATGGRAASPPIPGLHECGFLTNESVFWLTELPPRLAVIGAGPIGCELAQAFARFGAKVHLLDIENRILPREDADAAEIVANSLRRDGIDLHLGVTLRRIERRGVEKLLLVADDPDRELIVDEILVAAGRKPTVEGLGLDVAGVEYDPKKGVTVTDRLQTSNRHIFAAGDVCSRYQFTHAADAMSRIVLRNALFWGRARASALTIPWCTYTDPEVAHVGLYEHEARAQGLSITVIDQPLHEVDRAVLDGETEGFVRVLLKQGSGRILGATIVAAHAGELISEITLAMVGGLGVGTLADTIHPYPTQAMALKRVGDAHNRARLTPLVKWLFGKWLAWLR